MFCKTCHEYVYNVHGSAPHRCPPLWRCWNVSAKYDEDDGELIRGRHAEAAAEKYVAGMDDMTDGSTYVIGVRPSEGGPTSHWRVTAELEWSYATEPVTEDAPQEDATAPEATEAQEVAPTVRDDDRR